MESPTGADPIWSGSHGEEPTVRQKGWGSCCPWGLYGAAPEGWVLWHRAVLEQCLESHSLWDAHMGSVWEGSHVEQGQSDCGGAAEMKSYGLAAAPIPLHCLGGEEAGEAGRKPLLFVCI